MASSRMRAAEADRVGRCPWRTSLISESAEGHAGGGDDAQEDRGEADGAQQAEERAAPADAAEAVALAGAHGHHGVLGDHRRDRVGLVVVAHRPTRSRVGHRPRCRCARNGRCRRHASVSATRSRSSPRVSGSRPRSRAARRVGARAPPGRPRARRRWLPARRARVSSRRRRRRRSRVAASFVLRKRSNIGEPPPVGFGRGVPASGPGPRVKSLRKPVHRALARGLGGAGEVGRRVGRALDAGGLQRGDLPERAQLVGLVGQRLAHARAQADGQREQRVEACRARCSSSRAVFSPMPLAPGSPSDGSPRRAMKSGTCSGRTP